MVDICSFELLTQWDVNQIMNHINSTPRESLDGRTPYSVALETFGEEVLNAFQLRPIEPDHVNLTPKLIRFNHQTTLSKTVVGLEVNFSHFHTMAGGIQSRTQNSSVPFAMPGKQIFLRS